LVPIPVFRNYCVPVLHDHKLLNPLATLPLPLFPPPPPPPLPPPLPFPCGCEEEFKDPVVGSKEEEEDEGEDDGKRMALVEFGDFDAEVV
jgi:hypothetical protein